MVAVVVFVGETRGQFAIFGRSLDRIEIEKMPKMKR